MTDTTHRPAPNSRYLEALRGEDPLKSQKKAPKRLRKLVKGLTEKQLSRRPGEGKWSIKEIVGHMADAEFVNGTRMRFVAAHERPAIAAFDENLFAARLGNERAKTKELLDAFEALRAINLALVARLPKGAIDRIGIHSERGEESIRAMITMYGGHDRLHEAQIERVKAFLKADKKARKASRKAEKADAKAKKADRRAQSKKAASKSDEPAASKSGREKR